MKRDHKNYTTMTDIELVHCARDKDREAFSVLYQRYRSMASCVARRFSHMDDFEAEDILSDAVLAVFVAVQNGHGPTEGSVGGYLIKALQSAAAHPRRRRRAQAELLTDEFGDVMSSSGPAEPEWWIDAHDDRMRSAFATLPTRSAGVLMEVVVRQRPLYEVARDYQLTPNTAAVVAKRARRRLRDAYLAQADASDADDCRVPA